MSLITINNGLAVGDLPDILDAQDIIRQKFSPWQVNFTPEEKKKFFKLGYIRESFGDKIMLMGEQHPVTIPPDVDFNIVKTQFKFYQDLQLFKNNKADVDELIDCLIMNLGVLLLASFNRIYNTANDLSKKGNYPFSEMVKDAGQVYARDTQSSGTLFSIAKAGQMTINKLVPKSLFINSATTVLTINAADEVPSQYKQNNAITVNPGNSTPLPVGYTAIIVSNLSADTAGAFTVKLKK